MKIYIFGQLMESIYHIALGFAFLLIGIGIFQYLSEKVKQLRKDNKDGDSSTDNK